jgi:hypothetical protein
MKRKLVFMAVPAIALVFTLTVIGCPNPGGGGNGGGGSGPTSTVYEGLDGETHYKLEIINPSAKSVVYAQTNEDIAYNVVAAEPSARMAYTPTSGDSYVLTITISGTISKSTGTVTVKSGGFELKPSNGEAFTVKIESGFMTGMTGTITLDDGETKTAPASITPAKTFETSNFWANIWERDGASGEDWNYHISLEVFTSRKPKKGDTFKFKVTGTPNKDFKHFGMTLENHSSDNDWIVYKWLGDAGDETLTANVPFNKTFQITVGDDSVASDFTLRFTESLWHKKSDGTYYFNYGSLPAGTSYGTIMATISNFRISLQP